MKIALVPGSFDPVTNGHLDVIRRAAALFDRVVAVVMDNAEKTYLFSRAQRLSLLQGAVADIPGVTADAWDGMLWQYARRCGACAVVKGVRSASDFEYELLQARFNEEHCPEAQTVLLPAAQHLARVSSTEVRRRAACGEDLSQLVPENVCRALIHRQDGL